MPLKIIPDIPKAIRFPPGIDSPHNAVIKDLSLSGNQVLQN
jgi:hypothetical protein